MIKRKHINKTTSKIGGQKKQQSWQSNGGTNDTGDSDRFQIRLSLFRNFTTDDFDHFASHVQPLRSLPLIKEHTYKTDATCDTMCNVMLWSYFLFHLVGVPYEWFIHCSSPFTAISLLQISRPTQTECPAVHTTWDPPKMPRCAHFLGYI